MREAHLFMKFIRQMFFSTSADSTRMLWTLWRRPVGSSLTSRCCTLWLMASLEVRERPPAELALVIRRCDLVARSHIAVTPTRATATKIELIPSVIMKPCEVVWPNVADVQGMGSIRTSAQASSGTALVLSQLREKNVPCDTCSCALEVITRKYLGSPATSVPGL